MARPAVKYHCGYCGEEFGGREFMGHVVKCREAHGGIPLWEERPVLESGEALARRQGAMEEAWEKLRDGAREREVERLEVTPEGRAALEKARIETTMAEMEMVAPWDEPGPDETEVCGGPVGPADPVYVVDEEERPVGVGKVKGPVPRKGKR